jgi:hypothetical protein
MRWCVCVSDACRTQIHVCFESELRPRDTLLGAERGFLICGAVLLRSDLFDSACVTPALEFIVCFRTGPGATALLTSSASYLWEIK